MGLGYKIALRNIFRHKGRSFAVGIVIFIGAFFMTLGDGTINGMKKGIENNIIKGMLGDITIMSAERKDDNLNSRSEPLKIIERYDEVERVISNHKSIDKILPIVFGAATMLDVTGGQNQSSEMEPIIFNGVNYERYKNIFNDNIEIIEGESLKYGEAGILINVTVRESIYYNHDIWLLPQKNSINKENLTADALTDYNKGNLLTRNDLVLMGATGTNAATDVRVPIRGIFKYSQINEIAGQWNIIDLETARECMGYITTGEMITDLSHENKKLLSAANNELEMMFSGDTLPTTSLTDKESAIDDYKVFLKENNEEKKVIDYDKGSYTYALINLEKDSNPDAITEELNNAFRQAKLDHYARAVSFKKAWPVLSGYANIFQLILIILVNVIYFVAILMIANILSMTAIERTGEIGTMRVIGTQKRFITKMFIAETTLLSFIFGGLGIISAIVAIIIFTIVDINTSSSLLQLLFGGSKYHPIFNISSIIIGIIQILIVTSLGLIYPVIVVRRVKPIDAMKRD